MAKLTKAAARRRLAEAQLKVRKVYMAPGLMQYNAITNADINAIDKILTKAMRKLK